MKAVIYYYSLEDNTKRIAERIAEGTSMEVCRLIPQKTYPTNGLKFLFGGMDVIFKKTPKLESLSNRPEGYDFIVLATPVWASSFTPAIRSFLGDHNLSGKKIILVATSGGGDASKCFKAMREALGESEIVGEFVIKSPVADNENAADAVVDSIRKCLGGVN
ncbi:MAG: flavodoxin [Clostridiaceae bacterium]|nr:flavodoxin [Clostridiaceae bacterium]